MNDTNMNYRTKLMALACMVSLLFSCLSAYAQSLPMLINHGIDGSWINPEADGQGFSIETLPSSNTIIVYWYTFDVASSKREWYIAVGEISGPASELTLYRVEDGLFNQINMVAEQVWGTARIVFLSCTEAEFQYHSDLESVSGLISLQRLTPDVDCVADNILSHSSFVTANSSWLNAQGGHWVFEGCVELGPSESHGREDFWFDGATMSFVMVHYNSSGCQGPSEMRSRSFEMLRVDKSIAVLDGSSVISNRLLFREGESDEQVKQILYFDNSVTPGIMAHGIADGKLDQEGFPSELHNFLFYQQP